MPSYKIGNMPVIFLALLDVARNGLALLRLDISGVQPRCVSLPLGSGDATPLPVDDDLLPLLFRSCCPLWELSPYIQALHHGWPWLYFLALALSQNLLGVRWTSVCVCVSDPKWTTETPSLGNWNSDLEAQNLFLHAAAAATGDRNSNGGLNSELGGYGRHKDKSIENVNVQGVEWSFEKTTDSSRFLESCSVLSPHFSFSLKPRCILTFRLCEGPL